MQWIELDGPSLRKREPDLHERYTFGVLVTEAGHCADPGAYVSALVAHAQALGAPLVRAKASGFRMHEGRLRAVRIEDGGEIVCDAAVIACGARSKPLAALVGDAVPLETERGYHAMVDSPEGWPRTPMMLCDRKVIATLTEGGLRVAGQVEIAGLAAEPDWRRAQALREHLQSAFPALMRPLPSARVHYWMGHRPSMPDGLPCIGRATECRDIVHAFGHGHVGLGSSARTGRLVAQLLAEEAPEITLDPFDPRRFRWSARHVSAETV